MSSILDKKIRRIEESMKRELIYIGSVNKALKAKEILRRNGINSKIERGMRSSEGCGYSVLVVDGSESAAREILSDNGILGSHES